MILKCDECNIEPKNIISLNRHVQNFPDDLRLSRLNKCEYVTRTLQGLKNHRENPHDSLLYKFIDCRLRPKMQPPKKTKNIYYKPTTNDTTSCHT